MDIKLNKRGIGLLTRYDIYVDGQRIGATWSRRNKRGWYTIVNGRSHKVDTAIHKTRKIAIQELVKAYLELNYANQDS